MGVRDRGIKRYLFPLNILILVIFSLVLSQLCYSQEGEEGLFFLAEDIATWKSSIAAGSVELADEGHAIVAGAGGWGGGVASPWIAVDFAESPVLVINVLQTNNNWTLKLGLYQQDDQWGPYIQGDTAAVGEFSYKLPDALNGYPDGVDAVDPKATEDVQIRIWGTGAGNAQVWVESISIYYPENPADRPRFVDPELEKAYSDKNMAIESSGKLITLWGFIKY